MTPHEVFKHSARAWRLCLACLLFSLACYEHVTALVDLRLRIALSDIAGRPLVNVQVKCLDHEVNGPSARVTAVCRTDLKGACSARIRYLYSVRIYPWPSAKRFDRGSWHRFELLAFQAGREGSLGFLPPLDKAELFGDKVIVFAARVRRSALN
jgi:hypothetical protein